MITSRGERAAPRRRAALLVALALAIGAVSLPGARGQVACRIVGADAFFYSDTPRADLIHYYASVIMYTKDCGVSPAEVQATFRPVAGTPSTCDFHGTLFSEYALCRDAEGVAGSGTPVVIEAVGRTYGTEGADLFSSSCTLVVTSLPPGDGLLGSSASRASCPLPLE